ncbi:MAG: Lacal_2735 family protein [Putridiphycobacter sp.]|nr:Lacal_2735 family protein [Putridiphycobacter sp.]
MFDFFKKKSQLEVLQEKYATLLKEAHALSTTSRKESDSKIAEAEEVAKVIDDLRASKI